MHRREALKLLGRALPAGILATAGAGTYAVAVEPTWVELRRVRIPVPNLAPALDGLRILQLSDIHRSGRVSAEFVQHAIDTSLALEPELIALTGDFITDDPRLFGPLAAELAPLIGSTPAFAVPGNHDYVQYLPWERPADPDGAQRLGDALGRANIRLLLNESTSVRLRGIDDALELVGLDDYWSPSYDVRRAFATLGNEEIRPARLVLSHNPDSYVTLGARSFDVMLSGHTHGGQVRLPLVGSPISPVQDRRFIAGMVPVDGRHVYVNRGLGYNKRIRFGARPEITLIVLESA